MLSALKKEMHLAAKLLREFVLVHRIVELAQNLLGQSAGELAMDTVVAKPRWTLG